MHKYIAGAIGRKAAQALRLEVFATPKPGLVDRENSGAHSDMDYPLFLASIGALEGYFAECADLGIQSGEKGSFAKPGGAARGENRSLGGVCTAGGIRADTAVDTAADFAVSPDFTAALRAAGLRAEKAMFAATGGVNTHKGAIFSMGILCAALGQLICEKGISVRELEQDVLQKRCADLADALLAQKNPDDTHGAAACRNWQCGGIRAEARSGFAKAFHTGLPALKQAIAEGCSLNDALVKTLLSLMAEVSDSNAVHRGGPEGLSFIRKQAGRLLETADFKTDEGLARVREFDRQCVARSLSPGGSADLLAFSAMLYLVFEIEREI